MRSNDCRTRVLFWSEQFWPTIGGVEVWSSRLLPALSEHGYEFIVVTSHSSLDLPDTAVYKGIPIFRFPFWMALANRSIDELMAVTRQVNQLKRSFQPHLVHLNLTGPGAYFHLRTVDAHPARLLISLHDLLEGYTGGSDTLVGRTLRSADWVSSFSAAVLAHTRQMAPDIVSRSSLIYHGQDPPPLAPGPLPFDPPRMLCLGRLVPEKGFDLALSAFAIIAHRFSHARLVVASDGPSRSALEKQAAELSLTDRIDFLGWVPFEEMSALLNSVTMVLMPSRWLEGFGLVALDAALMARPIVATRSGGLPEAVVHGYTGLLVEREDTVGLAEAITHLLDHPDQATRMGQAARSRAQAVFSWQRHVDAFDRLYQRLLKVDGRVAVSSSLEPQFGARLAP